ncbi:MAG: MerR family transcriptional regulator [Candidatus Marinimicrobia bacterium]|nr:MerR family transcriptional regulator [Candidatus Neomarinimicrobiota bacterium]
MGKYSINEFSKITGLNKILIRTWENRYSFVKPHRTSTNIRYYDDKMIVKAIRYSTLVNAGFKISILNKLSTEQIDDLIDNQLKNKNQTNKYSLYISQILESSISFNKLLFHNTYEKCIKDIGIIACYQHVLLPVLNRIGILWINNKISAPQEHFLSELIKTKIYKEIERIGFKKLPKENWLLFLPKNELHDIGILFAYLTLKMNGHNVVYLGQNLPHSLLLSLKEKNKIDNILFAIVSNTSKLDLIEITNFLETHFSESKLHTIINKNLLDKDHFQNLNTISSIDEFINLITK